MPLQNWYYNETKTLIIPYYFDEKLKYIPIDTKIIIFEDKKIDRIYLKYSLFSQNVDKLPKNLTHLTLGYYFNKNIDNLPKNLTHLTLGCNFNKKIDNLPKNLTHLTLGCYFDKNIDNLPKNLTHIIFGECYNKKVDNLPISLKKLSIYNYQKKLFKIPFGCEIIELREYYIL
jgi:hypothetical protein